MSLYDAPDGCPGGDVCNGCADCLPAPSPEMFAELHAYVSRASIPVEASFRIVDGVVTERWPGSGPR